MNKGTHFSFLIGLFALLLLPTGCRLGEPQPKPWNVVLITFDTTRADRIGCYGNDRIETPVLDNLAAQGIRFANAMSTNPITAPSHTSIHTGRFPIAHGVRDNGLFRLSEDQVTLAEILAEKGFATAAAIGAFPLSSQFGLDQGFDIYEDHLSGAYENHRGERIIPKDRLFFDERRAAEVNEAIFPWLDEHADEQFFLWVHYFDPHQPFEPEQPYRDQYLDDLYNGEIAYSDASLGFLLDYIDRLGALENTLVVMTADHGEGLGEHNEVTHAVLAYDSTLHVPLIIRPPAGAAPKGLVIEDRVTTVDIVPTILDLLGLDWTERRETDAGPNVSSLQGRSLTAYFLDGKSDVDNVPSDDTRELYSENLSPALSHGWGELRVLYEENLKYIHGPRPEMYDLANDPDELNNLVDTRREDAARLRYQLEQYLSRHALEGTSTTQVMSPEVMEQLAALGYLRMSGDGGQVIGERLRDEGIPPQDRVADINDMSATKHLLFEERFAEALPFAERLMKHDPDSPTYQELYGSVLANIGRMDEAWALLNKMRANGKVTESFLLTMVSKRFNQGQQAEALDVLQKFVEGRPSATAAYGLARFYKLKGDHEKARQALATTLELEPTHVQARMDQAIYHIQDGNRDKAGEVFYAAVEAAPFDPRAHYNYGTFLVEEELLDQAEQHFVRAVELSPNYLKGYQAQVALYLTLGKREAAENAFERLDRMAPNSREAQLARQLLARPEVAE